MPSASSSLSLPGQSQRRPGCPLQTLTPAQAHGLTQMMLQRPCKAEQITSPATRAGTPAPTRRKRLGMLGCASPPAPAPKGAHHAICFVPGALHAHCFGQHGPPDVPSKDAFQRSSSVVPPGRPGATHAHATVPMRDASHLLSSFRHATEHLAALRSARRAHLVQQRGDARLVALIQRRIHFIQEEQPAPRPGLCSLQWGIAPLLIGAQPCYTNTCYLSTLLATSHPTQCGEQGRLDRHARSQAGMPCNSDCSWLTSAVPVTHIDGPVDLGLPRAAGPARPGTAARQTAGSDRAAMLPLQCWEPPPLHRPLPDQASVGCCASTGSAHHRPPLCQPVQG